MVETAKPTPETSEDFLQTMTRETDLIVARSRQLVKELEELLETGRQLRATQKALLEEREKNKRGK